MGLFVVFAGVAINTHPVAAATGINAQMNFQGRLLNSQGATVPDGFYNVQFKIYQDGDGQSVGDTSGSPAGTLKWTETYLNNNSQGVLVKNGFLSVQLGSITSLSSVNFNQDNLWLSMNIAGTNATCSSFAACSPDGEMTPMKRLSANAYSLNSQMLGGLSSSQFLQLGQGAQTDATSNSSIYVNKTSTGNLLQLQTGGTDAFSINNSGDVTLGANANHTLSVATAGASTAGLNLSVSAGAAGSGGTALAGGTLSLQGGAGGGTNGNGGNVSIDGGIKNGTGTNGTVNIGNTNASAVFIGRTGVATTVNGSLVVNEASTFNDNVTVAAGKSITLTGGNTASRPSSPAEGTVYYDTTTKQLLTYSNGKWQSDRNSSTFTIAASNATQAEKDGADYVVSGTADQTIINAALVAAAGGKVYLTEGTFSLTDAVSIPNNTTLAGAGRGTILRLANIAGQTKNAVVNTDTTTGTGVVIRDLQLDGNKTVNTSGTMDGINFNNVGSGSGASAIQGALITGVWVNNFIRYGINLSSSGNSQISNVVTQNNSINGLFINNSNRTNITQVTSQGNGNYGLVLNASISALVTSSTFVSNASAGVYMNGGNSNSVSNNIFATNGGSGTGDSIRINNTTLNTIVGNNITDTAGTGYAINIQDSASSGNLLSNNIYSGTGATSINDVGTGTIYNGQQNSNGYFVFSAAAARLGIGNVNPSYMLDVSGDINTTTGYRVGGTAGATTTCSSGQYLNTQVVQGGIITGGTCASISSSTTLQNVYDNSGTTPIIGLSSTGKGIFIRDASTTVGGNLFAIQNNAGTTSYLAVTTSGTSVAGTLGATGLITASNGFTLSTGALNLTATSGALALSGLGASSISTGANALTFTSSNFNTTATGINSTAIGATTASTGAFTTLGASGLVTASNGFTLSTGALNLTSTSGALALAGLGASSINTGVNALTVTASNFNTTATGINGTAIGATTAAAGTFTGVTTPSVTSTAALSITGGTTVAVSSTGANGASFDSGTTGAVNIGTGANAKVVTVGSTNTTSSTIIQSGSTGINLSGNTTVTGTLSGSSTINATTGFKFNGTAGVTATCSAGQFNNSEVVQGGIITGGSCAAVNAQTTLQNVYDNSAASPIIGLTSTGHGLLIRDASTTVGGNLFAIQNNAGTTSYLAVTTSGASIAGTLSATGLITASNGFTLTTGALNLTATSGALAVSGLGASSISTGANALTVTSSNFNTTATGINSTAIGATTASTGAFTTLTASGLATASNGLTLTTGALNLTATSGAVALSGLGASSISTGANALTVTSSNFNTTATGINSTAIGATTASTGAFTTITASSTIVGSSTVQATQFISTVATGTAPLTVASTTKVTNLNADLLDGLDSTAFLQTESDTLATVTGRGATTSTASSFNGGLTAGNGFTLSAGALNLTSTSGAIAISGLGASSISTGANALTITSSNFNTTATGINGTAIGASTAAAGTFTTVTTPTISSTAGLGITGGTTITVASTGANTASFDSGTTGAVNVGTGANAKVVTVGSINSTSSTIIQSGSLGITLTGNTTLTGTLSVSSTVNAVSGYKFNGTSGASTTCASGQYLQQQVVQGGITTGGTCTTVSPTTTLQQAYDNSGASPIITLSSTGHGLFIKDASTTVGGNLFAVQNNAGSTSYLAVTTSGTSVVGTFSATGTITASAGGSGATIVPSLILGTSSSADGTLAFKNHTDTNTITLNAISTSSSYTLTLPTTAPAGGLCIETSSGNAQQLVFASCANNNTSIQQVNAWDANNTNTLTISPATVGNEIVFTTQIPTSGVTVTGISGGGVTSWSKVVTSAGNGTVNRVEMWVGTVTASGSSTITVTYSAAPGAEEITATEFTAAGVNAATSWGTESFGSQLNSTSSSTVAFPSRTAVNGSELYVGYAQVQNPPATAGSTSGFNYRITSTQHNVITYNTALAANTTYSPTANQNTSGQSNSVAVVLTAFVTSTSINNTTSLQNANFYVQAASVGSVAGVLQAASSGTADILNLRNGSGTNVLTVGSAGNVLVKPAASTTAFQVQNAGGNGVLTVDTTNSRVVLGTSGSLTGALTFADPNSTNTITLSAPASGSGLQVAASYTLYLPNNSPTAGLCLATSPSSANQLVFSSCATQVSAASISYVGRWGNTGTSVTTIADAPSSKGNLVVFYSHATNNVGITGISGGGVTNWTKVTGNANTTGQGNNEMWRGVVSTAGSATITVTYSAAAGVNDIEAQEFTMGSSTGTWAIDTSGTAISSVAGTTVNFPNLTPLNSSELYTGYAWGGGTMSAGSTSGFTYQTTTASKYLAFNPSVVGGTAYQPTATQTSAAWNSIGAIIAAYTGTSVIVNSTAVQQANFDVQAANSGSVAGVLQAASGGTADILQLQDAAGNNVAAFNAANGLSLGTNSVASGQLNFIAKNGNVISIVAPDSPGSTYSLTLPTTTPAPGQCLATSPSNANQLVFSSCANQVTSIAITHVNTWKSSTVALTGTLGVSPASLGDLMTLSIFASKGNTITSVSGGGVTAWSRIIGANSEELWRGVVTSTGSSTISVTVSTPSGPTVELAADEWTTGSATGSWVIDTSGTISNASSTTVSYPNLTPQSTKDLYIGYAVGTSTMSAGSTSGFTYYAGANTTSEGVYNVTTSTTSQPTATQATSGTSIAVGALIAAYSSSSVISNSTNTQQANFNIQAATPNSVAGTLQAFFTGTGDIFDLLDGNGTQVGSTSSTGNLLVKPSTASASAFQVQTTGGTNVLSTDTSSKLVVIGAGSTGEATPSLLVLDNETGTSSDPTVLNGAMYYNATTHSFRCGVDGAWQSCTGLLYSNTSASSSNSNCSNNCSAFSTAAAIPANYCQPGRAIKLLAAGYFSSVATPSNLQFGVYYGTSGSSAASDTLLGTLPPTASVTSASNNYFQMNFNIVCFSTSSMQSSGILDIQTGASSAGMTALPMNSTSGTSVSSNTAKNLYIFPIWDTANTGNTATMTQFTVNGS